MTDFASLNLSAPLMRAIDSLGYTTPTPIQCQAIPDVIAGKDLMGIAQTGTGKTAAFALPVLDHISRDDIDPPKRGARTLVLAPTRELASQIAVSFRDYGKYVEHLTVACVYGGVPIHRQIKKLVGGNDVLIATPGRLIDLLDRKDLRLSDVEVLVLDEADQMMDMGFIHALKKIVPLLPKNRQTLFFSATMSPAIKKLASQFLTDPVKVSVTPANSTADKVKQSLIFVNAKEKQDLLGLTLLDDTIDRALVFTRTKHGADRVVKRLATIGLEALAIHGNKSQSQRQRALAAFREGKVKYLIATDIAARGIDIEGISHVINFEIPNVPEQYVHRIGRTARANREGKAIAFVAPDERAYLKDIQKLLKVTIPVDPLPEDFNNQSALLRKRPALPKPETRASNSGGGGRNDGGRTGPKRPKRKKRPKTAEELMNADNDGSQNPSNKGKPNQGGNRPGNPKGKDGSSKKPSRRERRANASKAGKPGGAQGGGGKPKNKFGKKPGAKPGSQHRNDGSGHGGHGGGKPSNTRNTGRTSGKG